MDIFGMTGCSFSPSSGTNQYPTTSGDSYPTLTVSKWVQFGNRTLRHSGEAAVAGNGSGRSLVSRPHNRLIEKADEDGRGYLGGRVVDGM